MKNLDKVVSRYKERPSLDTTLNLDSWNLNGNLNDRFENKEALVKYIGDELKMLWRFANNHSLLGLMTNKKEMINRLWKKRPTNIELFYSDGTKDDFLVEYTNDRYSELFLQKEEIAEIDRRKSREFEL
ncbi:MAG: hypothetical protein MJZ34_05425 [Paludibacteraceae bacterium]|nr:hypothetical protein [Paludibacteraceae bacterium]